MILVHIRMTAEPSAETVETVRYERAASRISELSGRPGLGTYILGTAVRTAARRPGSRGERAYVAAAKGSPWRTVAGTSGFHVEVVR